MCGRGLAFFQIEMSFATGNTMQVDNTPWRILFLEQQVRQCLVTSQRGFHKRPVQAEDYPPQQTER